MGIASSLKGFYYIKSAITKKYWNHEKYIGKTTTSLYPEVAQEYKTTGSRVERSIRHAVEISFSRGNIDLLNKIFGCSISVYKDKPTNSEFISLVVDYLKINYKNLVNAN